jgi:hypothetical protein
VARDVRDMRDPKFEIRNLKFEVPGISNFEFRSSPLLTKAFLIPHSEFANAALRTVSLFLLAESLLIPHF